MLQKVRKHAPPVVHRSCCMRGSRATPWPRPCDGWPASWMAPPRPTGAPRRKAIQTLTQPDPLPKRFQALPGPVGKRARHSQTGQTPPLPDKQVGGGCRCDGSGGRACPPMGSGATARSGGAASRQRAGGRGASERPSYGRSALTALGGSILPPPGAW